MTYLPPPPDSTIHATGWTDPPAQKTAGQVAYEAWGVAAARSRDVLMLTWYDPRTDRQAWEAAAAAVLKHASGR